PWGVQFPNAVGFRHPVVLYDGVKNFLLVPLLLWIRRRGVPEGRIVVLFVILYALFRIPIDLLRDYPIALWGVPTGQGLNIAMLLIGLVLLAINIRRPRVGAADQIVPVSEDNVSGPGWRRIALIFCCLLPLVIPSDATRDVPVTYGSRHAGLKHSSMYPNIQYQLDKSGPR
ncbi:MAG: hypothetical protein HKN25_16740, partial [Pyrinomonadaceae bacterium]|nr:hypothetical protein [Pyrinomonadaceae bacterium]